MDFQDVAFMRSQASFSNTFLQNCGRGESHGPTTCHKNVVGVTKGMFPEKCFCSTKPLFVSIKINADGETATRMN